MRRSLITAIEHPKNIGKKPCMKKLVMILLLIPLFATAQISKSGKFKLNDYVNLSTGAVNSVPVPNERSRMIYPCSTNVAGQDFFMNYFEMSTCICVCPSAAIGSPRPFYRPKKSLSTMDLRGRLKLTDTTLFTKIDTVKQSNYSSGCALPYIISPMNGPGPLMFIVTTANNNYALVILTSTITTVQCSDYSIPGQPYFWTHDRLMGYTATWYINTSGIADFSWAYIVGIQDRPGISHGINRVQASEKSEHYTLLGRRVSLQQVKRNSSGSRTPSLYILKTERNARLVLK
jgi:hypothetical protein